MSSILHKIESEIKIKGLTIADFTKKIGISRGGFYSLDENSLKVSTLKKIALTLDRPVAYFIEESVNSSFVNEPTIKYSTDLLQKAQQLIEGIQ